MREKSHEEVPADRCAAARRCRSTAATLLLLLATPIVAQLRTETVVGGLDSPVQVTHAGDDRLFVVEQDGTIQIVENGANGAVRATPFLDISTRVLSGGERGLLSVAFDPNFAANGTFYVNYTRRPDGATVIARYGLSGDPNRGDASSEEVVMVIDQPFSNHNGGQIHFGPDGMLYIATGDGGSGNDPQCHGQRRDSLLGKILRIDPNGSTPSTPQYRVPADNPFVGAGTFLEETWAVGVRNPFRFSFDRATGDLFLGDVGQSAQEEISFAAAGEGGLDFGWKVCEGNSCSGTVNGCPEYVDRDAIVQSSTRPILSYQNAGSRCSVTGGYRYRGSALDGFAGRYFYGDFCSGEVFVARRQGGNWIGSPSGVVVNSLSSFGEDRDGELYATSLSGSLVRFLTESEPGGEAGLLGFGDDVALSESTTPTEEDGALSVAVSRTGGSAGQVTARVRLATSGSAELGQDFAFEEQVLVWGDEDTDDKLVLFELQDDVLAETDENFILVLDDIEGGAGLARQRIAVTIEDDERRAGCEADNVLCLLNDRFAVRTEWRTEDGANGIGVPSPISTDSGHFWFFAEENVEVVVKMVNACGPFDAFWVFAAGLTDVEVRLTVVDTETGSLNVYLNPQKTRFQPINDTSAFSTCP